MTHDQDEALSVADRVVVLRAGRIVADGLPEELWRRPTSAWLARFLGYRNVAAARLAEGHLETPWGRLPAEAYHGAAAASGAADAGHAVVLSAAGLLVVAEGPIRGRVASRRFRGDHVLVGVEVPGAPLLHVEMRGGELPAVGEAVALRVLPGAAHLDPGRRTRPHLVRRSGFPRRSRHATLRA